MAEIQPIPDSSSAIPQSLRVLILHNRYRQPGGEDVVVSAQARLLKEHGHEVCLLEKNNLALDSYGLLGKIRLFFETSGNRRSAAEVARVAAEFKPQVALVHNTLPLLSPSIYQPLKQAGVKIVQWLHNYRLVCPAGTLYRAGQPCTLCLEQGLERAVEHRCWSDSKLATLALKRMLERHRQARTFHEQVDLFVALNSYQRDVLVQAGVLPAEKTIVAANFVYAMATTENSPLGSGFVYLGRLTAEKGIASLLKAAALAPHLPMTLIGDGPLYQEACARSTTGALQVRGSLPWEAVRRELLSARALVFPSVWQEPFGLSLIEAMALGKPVIAARVAGPREVVQDGVTGLLFEPGDVNGLLGCMRRLMEDPALAAALGAAGYQRYLNEYSPEAGYKRLCQICQRALR